MKLLLSFFLLLSSKAYSSSSYSVEGLVRSFPIGAFSKISFGKSYKLWGEKEKKKDILYGFIRPEAEFRTSVLVNYAGAKITAYPLPILGLYIGKEKGIRGLDNLHTFDCEQVSCKGEMTRDYIGLRAAIAYKKFFLTNEWRKSDLNFSKKNRPFVDEITTLLGNGSDQSTTNLIVTGLMIDNKNQLGLLILNNKMKNNNSKSQMVSIIHGKRDLKFSFIPENWDSSLVSSLGYFKTRQNQKVGTVLFQIKLNSPRKYLLF